MESGEIFGELSLILDENRKASVSNLPLEIIEINKNSLRSNPSIQVILNCTK